MVAHPKSLGRLMRLALWAALSCAAQTPLTLEQAGSRKPPDFSPVHEGEEVTVRGIVAVPPIERTYYRQIAIQDESGHGLTLEGALTSFVAVDPGDRIEARGKLSKRAGLPILVVNALEVVARSEPPAPLRLPLEKLQSFRYLAVLVSTEARVLDSGENQGGEYLAVGDERRPVQIFLPFRGRRPTAALMRFERGDLIRVAGIASQYCPIPPFNRYFQVVIASPDAVVLVQKRWFIDPKLFLGTLAALGLALLAWWLRERRMAAQRRTVKALYALSEEILGAGSPQEIVRNVDSVLPRHLGLSSVRLYLYHRATKSLERLEPGGGAGATIPINPPGGWLSSAAAACFRNQALLAIPDTRHSPFFRDHAESSRPRSAMYVPMLAHTELLGVLEICDNRRTRSFRADEQVMAQHLANQIALALRLMEEQTIREQLFRSERLAATGQLISGVVSELRAPLEAISEMADGAGSRVRGPELEAIAQQAEKASGIVARLLSFTRSEPAEVQPVDVCALLRNLTDFRRSAWRARGFVVQEQICPGPAWVLGSSSQLERVFLNLLVHAEQSLAGAPDKSLAITTSVLGRQMVLEIGFRAQCEDSEAGENGNSFPDEGVCHGLIRNHGGEIRLTRSAGGTCQFEIELPVVPLADAGVGAQAEELLRTRPLTILLVEPDASEWRNLMLMLGRRNCRAVPVATSEQAADLVGRLTFDLVFCSIRVFGLNWLALFERVREHAGGFVLLTEGFDPELARALPAEGADVIAKPIADQELDRVLLAAAARLVHTQQRAVQ